MEKILIIGCGLLGSSLLRRISKKRIAKKAMLDSATGTNPRVTQIEDLEELTEISILSARN